MAEECPDSVVQVVASEEVAVALVRVFKMPICLHPTLADKTCFHEQVNECFKTTSLIRLRLLKQVHPSRWTTLGS